MAIPTSDPALAIGRSMAGMPGMPSAAPMEDAGPGKRRSLDPLAAKMKPISCACIPARSRQSRAAKSPNSATVSCGAAKRRSAMPVTCNSHASSAPTIGAISALVTIREGKYRAESAQVRETHFFSK